MTFPIELDPYVQLSLDGHWRHPLLDESILPEDPLHIALSAWKAGNVPSFDIQSKFAKRGWAGPSRGKEAGRRFVVRYVNLEATARCNQRCNFCPVSISQRPPHVMSMKRFEGIVGDLEFAKDDIKGVFLFGYNEPSLDLSLLERVAVLRQNNLPVALNTNGSGFAPKLTDALRSIGGIAHLSVNLSTLDPEKYRLTRGHNHLDQVLRNLDYLSKAPVAEKMVIAVLDPNPDALASSAAAIAERFQDSPFHVQAYPTMNRAGLVPEAGKAYNHKGLMGCDCMGSRAVEHIQIDAEGNVILCCQDYHSEARMGHWQQPGDMMRILSSDRARDLRNLVHGVVEAPDDFVCRKCEFALAKKPVE